MGSALACTEQLHTAVSPDPHKSLGQEQRKHYYLHSENEAPMGFWDLLGVTVVLVKQK